MALPAGGKRLAVVAPPGQRKGSRAACRVVDTKRLIGRIGRFPCWVVKNVHHADERRLTVHDGGGALEYLDPPDLVQVQRRYRRVEGSSPGNIVHHQEE